MAKSRFNLLMARMKWLDAYAPGMRKRVEARELSIDGAYVLARKGLGGFELIYFVQAFGGGGAMKIGCSFDPYRRLKQLQMFSPVELVLIGFLPGNHKDEKRLHRKFKKQRAWGEWFWADDALWRLAMKGSDYKQSFEPDLKACTEANRKLPKAVA